MWKILTIRRNLLVKIRGSLLRIYLQLLGCRVGSGLRCHQFPTFRQVPKGNIQLGDGVTIGYGITFEVHKSGRLEIGSHVNLTQNILISSNTKVTIGKDTLIAENVSIRDGNHQMEADTPIRLQEHTLQPVSIGEDVWIGAGCKILEGAKVANGVVLGANSLVLNQSETEVNGIYVGAPIRFIRKRESKS
jgi:acetyltransferase-like isoleucine patch superfamily enzyme